jgi:hypothetical protein
LYSILTLYSIIKRFRNSRARISNSRARIRNSGTRDDRNSCGSNCNARSKIPGIGFPEN